MDTASVAFAVGIFIFSIFLAIWAATAIFRAFRLDPVSADKGSLSWRRMMAWSAVLGFLAHINLNYSAEYLYWARLGSWIYFASAFAFSFAKMVVGIRMARKQSEITH